MPLQSGTRLGRYEIRSLLGAGGMGEVYLSQDTQLNRQVALKVLPANLVNDPELLRRFEQEAQAASALNHPNIITIHEIGAEGDTHYIATELIEGVTLRRKLQTTRVEIKDALDIVTQIAVALNAAHRSGIVHRDIKPENVMLRDDGLVKLLDFGLAKLSERKNCNPANSEAATRALVKTNQGVVMGTVTYMSPEQARGLDVDARTDLFSLGTVLYETLTGRSPFAGETVTDTLANIIQREPAPLDGNTPPELSRIIRKALQKNRDERYQTAKDLLIDLNSLKHDLDFSAQLERSGIPTKADQTTPTQGRSVHATLSTGHVAGRINHHKGSLAVAVAVLLVAALGFGYWYYSRRPSTTKQIESIAVLPFVNESGNADVEYLSDGMTESLINSLSQLPNLSVKARSSVFRYKGKAVEPQQVASDLSVQAILNGRVVQRGDDLLLYLSLVDARTSNQIWGEQYNRKLSDLVTLQREIAQDVSSKLQVKLSGADEGKLAKNYTVNTEAYQLYLKGRYHVYKLTPPEVNKGISYFQQAIEIDRNYALAYAGLSDAYRSLALGGEMLPTELLPKAKVAAEKALEIDDALAEAHTALGVSIFWYDWKWSAAEYQFKRALELNPNSADAHLFYAHLLSNTGRHAEALAEVKRARELDPLSPFVNALEGQFLIHAGRTDEALVRLQKTFELEPNFWMAHLFASSAYIEKGMYTEAVAEARKASGLSPAQTISYAFGSYALAKSGKRDEARAALNELLKLSTGRFVPPSNIALAYNGLDETNETFAWLERGYQQRDPKMTFLKVQPKWNNLRSDPRFAEIMRNVGLPQ